MIDFQIAIFLGVHLIASIFALPINSINTINKKNTACAIIFLVQILLASAQSTPIKKAENSKQEIINIPISNAELGEFPYFKTFPNFYPRNSSDSVTLEQNRVFFFDGNNYFSVDGKVSGQKLSVYETRGKHFSEFQLIQEFEKVVTTVGGKKSIPGICPKTV